MTVVRCGARIGFRLGLLVFFVLSACDLSNSVAQRPHGASRVSMGPLVTSTWLPAGIDEFRFSAADQEVLAELGLTQLQWLQRHEQEGESAEDLAMAFASQQGMGLPVYYEPPEYSPYDKLRNWAAMESVSDTFDVAVHARASALAQRWGAEPGFAGYLIGHEDYRSATYEALARTVAAVRSVDSQRPAYTVGALGSYQKLNRFLDAFFVAGGTPNVFQHEHYVFEASVDPDSEQGLRRLDHLVKGYDHVASNLRDRHGRWHAIVQVHAESRDDKLFYRQPTAAEIRVQVGLALSRGASGIVYFLYSSGIERVLNGAGELVQTRQYVGLVDDARVPTAAWQTAQQLNQRLRSLSPVLEGLSFRGGYEARYAPADEPLSCGEQDLDLAFFGNADATSHVLVVNRRMDVARSVVLEARSETGFIDVESETPLQVDGKKVGVSLAPGGFALLQVAE